MIEVVFVIVVLGILAAIAIPKFATTRNDALISKARADISTIRSAIVSERQGQLVKGTTTWIPKLSSGSTTLFTGDGATPERTLLMYGIKAGTTSGKWARDSDTKYTIKIGGTSTVFTYDPAHGTFKCTPDAGYCNKLVD